MAFDLEAEFGDTHDSLDKLGELVQRRVEELRTASDFGLKCQQLVQALDFCIAKLPPPEPTPPVTQTDIVINEHAIEPASRWRRWVEHPWMRRVTRVRRAIDVRGMIPVVVSVRRTAILPDPMMPGSPARDFEVELDVHKSVSVPLDDPPGAFEYRLQVVKRKFTVHMDAVPPNAPLTPEQAAYVQRLDEIATEIRDITTFLRDTGGKVAQIKTGSDALQQAADALIGKVDRLSGPPDIVGQFEEMRERVQSLEQELPAIEQDINRRHQRLAEVEDAIKAVCPELHL